MKYAITDGNGYVVTVGTFSLPNGAEVLPNGSPVEAGTWRKDESGDYVARPQSPMPTKDANEVTIPPCPIGTKITIMDVSGDESMSEFTTDVEDWTDVFVFDTAGVYQITVLAPDHAIRSMQTIEVTDADINP